MTCTILLQKCFMVFFTFEKGQQASSEKEQQERQDNLNRSTKYVITKLVGPTLCDATRSPGIYEESRGSSLPHKSGRHTLCLKSEITCLGGHLSTGGDNED